MKTNKPNRPISRRHFMKNATYGLTGAALLPTLLPSCTNWKGANDRLQIGHIGVGSRGGGELKGYFLPLEGSRSVAICDLFKDRREKGAEYANRYYKDNNISAPESIPYMNYEELLERDDIDAVNITTTDHWHVLAAIRAAEAGKHVMLAKPLGLSYPNYLKLKKALKDNDVRFHYGTQQRAAQHMQMGIDMIQQGKIGEIERVEVWAPGKNDVQSPLCSEVPVPDGLNYEKWIGPAPMQPYCPERVTNNGSWFNNDYSIGFLAGWGAHPLDIMIGGMKEKLSGSYSCEGSGTIWPGDGLYNNIFSWDLKYQYENGMEVHFLSSGQAEKKILNERTLSDNNKTTFYGSKGWISLGRSAVESDIKEIDQKLNAASKNSDSMGQLFLDVIKGEREEACPLEDAILSDTISHMGDMAIRMNRKVTWDPNKGETVNDPEANKLFVREMREPYRI